MAEKSKNYRSAPSGRWVQKSFKRSKSTSVLETVSNENGVCITRDAKTGKLYSVRTTTGVKKRSSKSSAAVKEASVKRHSALKRLADR